MKTTLLAAAAFAGLVWTATAEEVKVGKIPADAEIVFASKVAKEPDATGIGFADELYVANARGGNVTRITYSRWSNNHFNVSPDRKLIVTNRMSRGDTDHDGQITPRDSKELWIVDVEHGREYKIAPGLDAGLGGVAWAPDSRTVYFSAASRDGLEVYKSSVEPGSIPVPLTQNLNKLLGQPDVKKGVTDVGASPDGKWLAMLYIPDVAQRRKVNTRIVLFKLDGSEARILTDGGPLRGTPTGIWPNGDFDPDISFGNRFVAFERATKTDWSAADIVRVRWDGSDLLNLSIPNNTNINGIPSWSASCKVIYTVWTKTSSYPEYINWDGSGRIRIPVEDAHHVQWIPGGGGKPSNAC